MSLGFRYHRRTKVCANLTFREQEGYYICDLPSPNVAGETLLTIA